MTRWHTRDEEGARGGGGWNVPVVELRSVLQQLFSGHASEDGFQRVQSRLGTVLYVQPVEQLREVSVQPLHPGRQQARAEHLPHRFCNTRSQWDVFNGHQGIESWSKHLMDRRFDLNPLSHRKQFIKAMNRKINWSCLFVEPFFLFFFLLKRCKYLSWTMCLYQCNVTQVHNSSLPEVSWRPCCRRTTLCAMVKALMWTLSARTF